MVPSQRYLLLLHVVVVIHTGNIGHVKGTECAFNPCMFQNICREKTCVLTDTCSMYCTCDENSTSPDCVNVTTAASTVTSPTGCSCVNGYCSTSHGNITVCVCDNGWGGERCELPCSLICPGGQRCIIPVPDFPSMAICQDVTTESGCTCVNGHCSISHDNRTICVCDTGWDGEKCELPCTLNCPEGQRCMIPVPTLPTMAVCQAVSTEATCDCVNGYCSSSLGSHAKCVCNEGWDGEKCELPCSLPCPEGQRCVIPMPNLPSMAICQAVITDKETTTLMMTPSTEFSQNRTYNVCDSTYTLRPKSERECSGGFKCLYGSCSDSSGVRCECDPGASGQVCQHECCRECVHGSCFFITEENRAICNCQANYSGPFCELWDPPTTVGPPEEVTWPYWVVGACVTVLLILLTLMVVVPYIMWKNRVILVMKVVHYFQGYEDDDDRQWDAFISYKSTKADEGYVVRTLFPKLERELGFKVNVHFRDFVPGETIANNIITAVQSSRRTIMIITPSYVTSEFTKFEYQVAQQEMLKRKHRIIPILLEDIADCKDTMDPNLKVILDSVTYIEWPKDGNEKKLDKFWKRIELSMPKIKNRSPDSKIAKLPNSVTMTKPEDINISFCKDKDKSRSELSNGHTHTYSIIDDRKLEPEEVYDTLNESEMQSKVIARNAESGRNPISNSEGESKGCRSNEFV